MIYILIKEYLFKAGRCPEVMMMMMMMIIICKGNPGGGSTGRLRKA